MADFVFPPPAPPSLPVAGTAARFPVRRIFCVGRNYAAHAREMGRDPDREPPFFFMKPADAVVEAGVPVPYPPKTADLHHEGEMVVALGAGGRDVAAARALSLVWGYAVGIDLTRRDVQARAKEAGRPWDLAKGFDASAVVGPVHPAASVGHPASGRIATAVDGALRQEADLADMIWTVPEMIAILSAEVALAPGDLVFTGTPAGVGAVVPGEVVTVTVEGLDEIAAPVTRPRGESR